MKNQWSRASLVPLFVLGILALAPVSGLAQEDDCKGKFVDGECVQGYVYVPDYMSPQDLKKDIDEHSKDIVIVDTAAPPIFEDEHIPGAVNLPYSKNIAAPAQLSREKTLVLYCACKDDEDSRDVAQQLSLLGYQKVKVLKGGWFKWLDLKYETVSKDDPKAGKG
jgi:rhodanese-related sulfurtransferase